MSEIDKRIEEKRERLTKLVGSEKADKIIKQDIKRKENEDLFTKGVKIGFKDNILGIEQLIRSLNPKVSEREKELQNIINERAIQNRDVLNTGWGTAGNIVGTAAPAVGAAFIPGGQTYTGMTLAGLGLGAIQPTTTEDEALGTEDQSRLINTAIGGAAGIVGKAGGDKISKILQNRIANQQGNLNKLKIANQVRDNTIKDAQELGYVIPPAQVNKGSTTQKILESAGGKIQTSQQASLKNQIVTNNVVKKALNIADDQPLTIKAIDDIIEDAAKVYKEIEGLGTFKIDSKFTNNVSKSIDDYKKVIEQLPDRKIAKLDSLIKTLDNMEEIDASNIIVLVKALQKENKALWKAGDDAAKQMQAKVQSSLADDLLDLVGRNMDDIEGLDKTIINEFKKNRVIIAKANAVKSAYDSSTGDVSAGLLAKNKYLTDELKTIVDAYNLSPKSFQVLKDSKGVSFADFGIGFGTMAITGNPLGMGVTVARPLIRGGLLNKSYQKAIRPNYKTSNILDKLGLGVNKFTPPITIGAGATQQNRGLLE